ncbi:hypothetical protein BKA70DRAFT_1417846 [Coprinopsis sp. MPI-PUGE-AT-0042]|nr:hypothetical protein BKA70DRAFT_1417846 [Coprinopsis sp. MPI-PUGE-AT-0042]
MAVSNDRRRHSVLNIESELRPPFAQFSDIAQGPAAVTFTKPTHQPLRSHQPNKLQKQRKGVAPPYHQVPRRPVSFDLSTLSDLSTRGLINGRISVARYGQHTTPFIHRAVLRKNRDGRAVTAYHRPIPTFPTHRSPGDPPPRSILKSTRPQPTREDQRPVSPPLPLLPSDERHPERCRASAVVEPVSPSARTVDLLSLQTNISHLSSPLISASWTLLPPDDRPPNVDGEQPPSLLPPTQLPDPVAKNNQHRYSMPLHLPPINVGKPLPPKPSALVEEFSPSTLHRRWTITSYPSTHGCAHNDILADELGLSRGQSLSFSDISAPPKSITTPITGDFTIEEHARGFSPEANPKLQELLNDFIETQRSYVATLRKTVANESNTPPVDLLLAFLSVIEVSEEFLREMQLDPSPLGIANAFLYTCGKLESHLLQWSNEVTKFVESTQSAQIQVSARPDRHYSHPAAQGQRKPFHKGSRFQKESFIVSLFKRKPLSQRTDGGTTVTPDTLWQRSNGGPGLWEMAVLPTQRTMRYAFLFKEILSLLDASDVARQATERAFHAATCVAQKMTQAQQRPSLYFV